MIQIKYAVVFPKYFLKSLGEKICCREQTARRKVKPKYPVGRNSTKYHIRQDKSLCLCSPPSPREKCGNTLPHILHFPQQPAPVAQTVSLSGFLQAMQSWWALQGHHTQMFFIGIILWFPSTRCSVISLNAVQFLGPTTQPESHFGVLKCSTTEIPTWWQKI